MPDLEDFLKKGQAAQEAVDKLTDRKATATYMLELTEEELSALTVLFLDTGGNGHHRATPLGAIWRKLNALRFGSEPATDNRQLATESH